MRLGAMATIRIGTSTEIGPTRFPQAEVITIRPATIRSGRKFWYLKIAPTQKSGGRQASGMPFSIRVLRLGPQSSRVFAYRTAGLLAPGSSYQPALPTTNRLQWICRPSSPVTAAGPRRICTVFPQCSVPSSLRGLEGAVERSGHQLIEEPSSAPTGSGRSTDLQGPAPGRSRLDRRSR